MAEPYSTAESIKMHRVSSGRRSRIMIAVVAGVLAASIPGTAAAHYERQTHFPDGTGHVPVYRTSGPHLVVCKQDEADLRNRIAGFPPDLQTYNLRLFAECM